MNIDQYQRLDAQLSGLYKEMSELSKKKPNDAINKFKLKLVNKILLDAHDLLRTKYEPFADFDQFDEDDIPTNSDVVIVLSQYQSCLANFHADNVQLWGGRWYWVLEGDRTEIETYRPKRF